MSSDSEPSAILGEFREFGIFVEQYFNATWRHAENGLDFDLEFDPDFSRPSNEIIKGKVRNIYIILTMCRAAAEWSRNKTVPETSSLSALFDFYGDGRTPAEGKPLSSDRTTPIREISPSVRMFRDLVMNKSILTSSTGIGGFLWVTKTCQGPDTTEFYRRVGFPLTKADLLNAYQTWDISEGRADFQTFYGTASHDLTITGSQDFNGSTQHLDLAKETIDSFFSQEAVDGWTGLLGHLLDSDLNENIRPAATWSTGRDFLRSLSTAREVIDDNGMKRTVPLLMRGYKDGLMAYSATNLLAYLGIIERATLEDVEEFMSTSSPGGNRALGLLGFDTSNSLSRRAAFRLVYRHLERNIDEEDKKALIFSPTFVEHILCKFSRFVTACKVKKTVPVEDSLAGKTLRLCAKPLMDRWRKSGALDFHSSDLADANSLQSPSSRVNKKKKQASKSNMDMGAIQQSEYPNIQQGTRRSQRSTKNNQADRKEGTAKRKATCSLAKPASKRQRSKN